MAGEWSYILLPLLTVLVVVFVALRLRLFADGGLAGRWSFVFGGLLVLLAALWQSAKATPSYYQWFVPDAYYWLEWGQLLLLVGGVLLLAVGLSLYSDYWQIRGEQIELRDRRLSLMENLQLIAREPYQLLQLLDISLKEILCELPDASGCIFLLNRARRQLVLTASVNLTPDETTLLEHYPFGRNLVSRTAELGEASLAANFELFDRNGQLVVSRFQSSLLLPLVSSSERIGVVVLLGEPRNFFTPGEVRYLAPAVQWLAEKIKSARLTRELAVAKSEVERQQSTRLDIMARLTAAAAAFSAADAADTFCRSLVGLHGCDSVHLVVMAAGGLMFPGGSEPMLDLTENYQTAIVDALDRDRPLIINQEAVGENDRTIVAQSTLLYPLGDRTRPHALLFRREGGPFKVAQSDLKTIGVFARLAQAVQKQQDLSKADITRRKGFDKVLKLLRFDSTEPLELDPDHLVKHMSGILPSSARMVVLKKHPDGSFRGAVGDDAGTLHLLPGEGIVAEAAGALEPVVIRGHMNVAGRLEELQLANREACFRLLGGMEAPSFMAAYPLVGLDDLCGLILVFIEDGPGGEQAEWERLLTLALGLYSVRMTIAELRRQQTVALPNDVPGGPLGGIVNRLNNHLSALIGNAELGMTKVGQPIEVRRYLESIVDEAEKTARYVRRSLGQPRPGFSTGDLAQHGADDINQIITAYLDRVRISDSLFMIGGRPREIFLRLFKVAPIRSVPSAIAALVEEAVGRLASVAREDEVITISSYRLDRHVYLDLSRHGRELPPVDQIARFGDYVWVSELSDDLPDEKYLSTVAAQPCQCSIDRSSGQPSYLSFRFPVEEAPAMAGRSASSRVRLLAIDDQTVILDLITAMCRSLDYEVATAESGAAGLELAEQQDFDIILADLAMPGASGLDVARQLKEIAPGVPVILVTGWEVTIQPEQLRAVGIIDVLHKPFRIEQLTEIVRSATTPKNVG